ncbi:alpha/beta-hydrolase [Acephala macrosclerotiorum]|nr:alpha/beta-hydrolase [Acephala macrosclerotiorum]
MSIQYALLYRFVITSCATLITSSAPYRNTTRSASTPIVTIKNGSYARVYNDQYSQNFFLRIPYAQPPINDLRFRVPRSLNTTWNGTRDAAKWSPFCVGYGVDDEAHDLDEDCLYLNVFRPHLSSSSPNSTNSSSITSNSTNAAKRTNDGLLSAVLWIHGGGLFMGGTNDQRYNASFLLTTSVLISKPILAASIQYCLSPFCFLGVQENIEAFGGNPRKVTIWGESAGAQSVGAHLLAYGGRDDGLFRGAIAQSSGPAVNFFPVDLPLGYNSTAYQSVYYSLVSNTSCSSPTPQFTNSLDCLRALPFSELNIALNVSSRISGLGPFVPTIDNDFIARNCIWVFFNVSSDEEFLGTLASTGISPNSFPGQVIPYLWPNIEALGIPSPISYPNLFAFDTSLSSMLGTQFLRLTSYFGDIIMHAPSRLTSHTWSKYNAPLWSYCFDVHVNGKTPVIGATHFSEVVFVFNNILGVCCDVNPFGNLTSETTTFDNLANLMSRSWISFIVDGVPNNSAVEGAAYWSAYNSSAGGGEGWNMVWTVNGMSYVEWDTFRAEAIGWVGDNLLGVYGL